MPATYFPAVIDRSATGFGVSYPDFPGCIANGSTVNEAAVQAELALAFHIDRMAKDGDAIPDPSDLGDIEPVDGADDVARILVRVDRPTKVARVLVSLDENLVRQIDAIASNRSAFLADAARSRLLGEIAGGITGQGELATMNRRDLEREYGLERKHEGSL